MNASALAPRRAVASADSRSPDPSHCLLARLGQELAVGVAADAEPEEVEPLAEVDDPGLGLVEGEGPWAPATRRAVP